MAIPSMAMAMDIYPYGYPIHAWMNHTHSLTHEWLVGSLTSGSMFEFIGIDSQYMNMNIYSTDTSTH